MMEATNRNIGMPAFDVGVWRHNYPATTLAIGETCIHSLARQ